jgi:hypothetical protein
MGHNDPKLFVLWRIKESSMPCMEIFKSLLPFYIVLYLRVLLYKCFIRIYSLYRTYLRVLKRRWNLKTKKNIKTEFLPTRVVLCII